MQKPRLATLPAILFAAGLGMAMYYGEVWWHLPSYSAAEIEQSVDLNLALDLQQRPAGFASNPVNVEALRAPIRQEIVEAIAKDAREPQVYAATGVLMMAIGFAQMVLMRRWATR